MVELANSRMCSQNTPNCTPKATSGTDLSAIATSSRSLPAVERGASVGTTSIHIKQTLTHAWIANLFNSCELLRGSMMRRLIQFISHIWSPRTLHGWTVWLSTTYRIIIKLSLVLELLLSHYCRQLHDSSLPVSPNTSACPFL